MDFDSSEGRASYLQKRLDEAGLEVRANEHGVEVLSVLPDPAMVEAMLRRQGIKDEKFIRQAVSETNDAIRQVEHFIQNTQAHLSTLDLTPGIDEEADAVSHINKFVASLSDTMHGLVPAGFYLLDQAQAASTSLPSPTTTGTSSPTTTGTPARTVAELTPEKLLSMETQTPSGLILETEIVTSVSSIMETESMNIDPGLYVVPFRSAFDSESATQLYS